jgi:hypothetical protein
MTVWHRPENGRMSESIMGKPTFLVGLVATLCISTLAQQNPSSGAATDLFLGKWTLNVDKSSPGPTAGTITIEPEKKKYRITLELAYHGNGGTSWTVSDMKGWASPVIRKPYRGIAIPEEWDVKREAADRFTISSVFSINGIEGHTNWRYTVSPDGKTLTRQVISGGSTSQRNQVLVFEKAQ